MARSDYEQILRRIVLYSADVMPKEVAAYVDEVAGGGDYYAKKQVFKDYLRIAGHLARKYVDYVLDYLILKPRKQRRTSAGVDIDLSQFGINDDIGFFPPAPVQGPFLHLLRVNEDEGLRLVHTLTNTAVAYWRELEQSPSYMSKGRIPLPTIINLQSGPREFWGDVNVYYWFRSMNNGPNAVTSALMALEVWIEEQIESDRNPDELFEKILSDSSCVAVLGVCIGVTMAYYGKCLEAALPIVSSPAIWQMDISRYVADASPTFRFDPADRDKVIYDLIEVRDKRPQRSFEIRQLATMYALSSDESLRIRFQQALAGFTENLPFLYKDQRENLQFAAELREQMENFQAYADPANYRQKQVEAGTYIYLEFPDHIKARNEAKLAPIVSKQRAAGLLNWTRRTIQTGTVADGMTLEEAVSTAKEIQGSNDFSSSYDKQDTSNSMRLQAIAGAAASILITGLGWAKENDHYNWCRDTLLSVARMPSQDDGLGRSHNRSILDIKTLAGIGLGVIVTNNANDTEAREQILRLVTDTNLEVVTSVFKGIYNVWAISEVLCWNALSLGLSLSLEPRRVWVYDSEFGDPVINEDQQDDAERLFAAHLSNLNQGVIPDLPAIPIRDDIIFLWDLALRVLQFLPLQQLLTMPIAKARLIGLLDDLMAWTVAENAPREEDKHWSRTNIPYEWNHFFFNWAAAVSKYLNEDEARRHVLNPVRDSWSSAPHLTGDLLNGYVKQHIGYLEPLTPEAQSEWREICAWVLDSAETAKAAGRDYLTTDMADAISLIVFVINDRPYLKDEWPHVAMFTDVVEKWVRVVGHNPRAYSYLLTMLNGPGWAFVPEPALEWMAVTINANVAPAELLKENSNGERTAEFLQRMWNVFEQRIRNDKAALQRYSDIIDRLVIVGVRLASVLQQELEQRGS